MKNIVNIENMKNIENMENIANMENIENIVNIENMEDIENISFLPESSMNVDSVTDFYQTLKDEAAHFDTLFTKADKNGNRLKYVAEFNNGSAKVGLHEVGKDHPFYNLDGKDNIVLFYTERYVDQPLIIKGAGAGAEVTASGLFGDIISLGKK